MDEKLFNRLKILINKTYYKTKRYKTPATFAYLYHEKKLNLNDLGKYIRKSDHLLKIDKNHYFVHFAYTERDHAFKASQNLLLYLDKHFNDSTSYIAIDTFDTTKSPTVVFNRLKQILDEIRKNSDFRIADEDILGEIV